MAKVSKRLTDTGKWKRWFRKAEPAVKLMWLFLLDECLYTGVWKVELDEAEFCIGTEIDVEKFLSVINEEEERVVVLNDKYWFLPGFIPFQFGDLCQNGEGKRSILKQNVLNGLNDFQDREDIDLSAYVEDYTQERVKHTRKKAPKKSPEKAPKEKDNKIEYSKYVRMNEDEYNKLVAKYGKSQTKKMIDKLDNHKGSNGKVYKDDYRAILNWVIDAIGAREISVSVDTSKSDWYHKIMNMQESSRELYAKYLPESEQIEIFGEVKSPKQGG